MKFKVKNNLNRDTVIDSSYIQMYTRESNCGAVDDGRTVSLDEIVLPCGYVYLISETCEDLWNEFKKNL